MAYTTLSILTQRISRMQKLGMDIALDRQAGTRCRITNGDGSRNLSPRGSKAQTDEWLDAFQIGWDECVRSITKGHRAPQEA